MHTCAKADVVKVVDTFIEDKNTYYIIQQPESNLRESILDLGITRLREAEVHKCLIQLLNIVQELHQKRIRHGGIILEAVHTKKTSRGLKLMLGGFDNARIIHHANESSERRANRSKNLPSSLALAKKIEDDVSMQLTDDIYDIGFLTFELLDNVQLNTGLQSQVSYANMSEAINNQKYVGNHWSQVSDQLKELLAFMVQED